LLSVGAVGIVGTSTHWTAPQFQQLIAAFRQGDAGAARAINARLIDSFSFINSDTSVFPMSIKAMLRTLGQEAGECRLPLPPTPPEVEQQAREVWKRLNAER